MKQNLNIKIWYHEGLDQNGNIYGWYHVIQGNTGYSGSRQSCLLFIEEQMKKLKEED